MTLELTYDQLDLLQYANDARDFNTYIYAPSENSVPSGW